MAHTTRFLGVAATILALLSPPAQAEPVKCQKTIVSQLKKFKKVFLKAHEKCLDADNIGKIAGPCPDAAVTTKLQGLDLKIIAKVSGGCEPSDPAALGYSAN